MLADRLAASVESVWLGHGPANRSLPLHPPQGLLRPARHMLSDTGSLYSRATLVVVEAEDSFGSFGSGPTTPTHDPTPGRWAFENRWGPCRCEIMQEPLLIQLHTMNGTWQFVGPRPRHVRTMGVSKEKVSRLQRPVVWMAARQCQVWGVLPGRNGFQELGFLMV